MPSTATYTPRLMWGELSSKQTAVIGVVTLRIVHNSREGADAAYVPEIDAGVFANFGEGIAPLADCDSLLAAQQSLEEAVHVPTVRATRQKRGWRVTSGASLSTIITGVAPEFAVVSWYPWLPHTYCEIHGVFAKHSGAMTRWFEQLQDKRCRLHRPATRAVAIVVPLPPATRS